MSCVGQCAGSVRTRRGAPPIPRQKWRANVSVMHAPCAPDVVEDKSANQSRSQRDLLFLIHGMRWSGCLTSFHGAGVSLFPQRPHPAEMGRHGDSSRATRPVELCSLRCPCRQSPRRTYGHSCTACGVCNVGGLLDISRNPISLVQNTEQREGYARRVASRRSIPSPAKGATRTIRNNDSTVRLLGPSHQ